MASILIIEDDADVTDTIQACVQRDGYVCQTADTGEAGLEICQQLQPDIVILDIGLPGMDGLEVCTQIRRTKLRREPYIIMLTARQEESDFLIGYAMGADDYLAKPFSPKILSMKIRARLRRDLPLASEPPTIATSQQVIRCAHLQIELEPRQVSVRSSLTSEWVKVFTTNLEFSLLALMAKQPGRVWERGQLIERVWTNAPEGDEDSKLESCIKRLRAKLRSSQAGSEAYPFIKTVQNVGYKFEDVNHKN